MIQPHTCPATVDEATEWVKRFNQKCVETHVERMKQWEYLQSDQYLKDLNEQLLKESHNDIKPPWE